MYKTFFEILYTCTRARIHSCIYSYMNTFLLLLISMLWHRQAIFESKGDKLSSSAERRIRSWEVSDTNSPADWMPSHKPTEVSAYSRTYKTHSYVHISTYIHYYIPCSTLDMDRESHVNHDLTNKLVLSDAGGELTTFDPSIPPLVTGWPAR